MALASNELYSSSSTSALPSIAPSKAQPKTLANVAGGPTYTKGTPMAYNTSTNKWVVWTSGGANGTGTIKGFLLTESITVDATNDSVAMIMMEGHIDYNSIVLPSGELEADLKTALRSGPRDIGLFVYNLDQVR